MKKILLSSIIALSLFSFTPVFAVEEQAPEELVSAFQKILLSFKKYFASINRTTQTGAGFLASNGLTAHYTFDDTSNDATGNGHNATLSGSPTYVAGKTGKALNLNGSNQYATRDGKVVTSFPFTFSAWVKGSGIIVSTEDKDANTPYYNVGVTGTTASLIARDSIGNEDGIYSGGVKVGEWNHVVAVFQSADNRRLYVNGVEKATGSVTKTFNTAVDRLSIGRTGRSAHGGYFNGQIDDVRIYSIALVQEEVTSLYSGEQPPTSTGDAGGSTGTNTNGGSQNTQTGSTPTPPAPTDPILRVKTDGSGNYRSISECAGAAKAGNTCLVYPGTYKENISLSSSGTAGNPITLKAAFPYDRNSTENRTVVNGVITVKNHAVVEGFEVGNGNIVVNGSNVQILGNYIHGSDTYAPYDGVSVNRVKPYYSNITIKNNRLYQLSHGMGIFCSDNCLIENNEIERLFTIERCRALSTPYH